VKRKTIKLAFAASPLSTHGGAVSGGSWVRAPRSSQIKDHKIGICCFPDKHSGVRAKTGLLGIRMMCPSGTTCLSADCCFSELALHYKNPTKCVGLVQRGHHHHLIEY